MKQGNGKDGIKRKSCKECFIIMPFSDQAGYEPGHFTHVYEDIIVPACERAAVKCFRGDTTNEPNIIHVDIVKNLIEAPLCICDMSSRNPNVMFELGLRQAFRLPTVLIADDITPQIFDVAPIRCMNYNHELKYRDVRNDQERLSNVIRETVTAKKPIPNSILDMLGVKSAIIPEMSNDKSSLEKVLQLIQSRMDMIERSLNRMFVVRGNVRIPGLRLTTSRMEAEE